MNLGASNLEKQLPRRGDWSVGTTDHTLDDEERALGAKAEQLREEGQVSEIVESDTSA